MSKAAKVVVWKDPDDDQEPNKLARRIGVELVECEDLPERSDIDWILFYEDDSLHLYGAKHSDYQPFALDYLAGDFARRWKSASRNDLLLKAVGTKKGNRSVLDATCGLGQDAFFLATQALQVTTCERSTIAWELVNDALMRVKDSNRFEDRPVFLYYGDAKEFLQESTESFDVIYLDPMYPRDEQQTAKQKKEMALFRELVGDDTDVVDLFTLALTKAKNRVVVKRPDGAEYITGDRKPDIEFAGTTVRYDVYLTGI